MNLFPGEHIVTFRSYHPPQAKMVFSGEEFPPEGEAMCIVRKSHVTSLEGGSGLVTVTVQDINWKGKMAKVGVFNVPDSREDIFIVPLENMLVPIGL